MNWLTLRSMRHLLNHALGKTVDDNTWYLCVEIFWATIYASTTTFIAAYAIRLGASNSQISLLSSIPALLAVAVALPSGRFLQSRKKWSNWVLSSLVLARTVVLMLALVPLLTFLHVPIGGLAVLIVIMWTIPASFFNVGFLSLLSGTVAIENRADTFAARNIISGITLTVCTYLLGIWLVRIQFPYNYQIMFVFGFGICLLSQYYLNKLKVPDLPPPPSGTAGFQLRRSLRNQWRGFIQALRDSPAFTRIMVNTILHSFGMWMAAPLYVLYFLNGLGASEAWLGLLGSITNMAAIGGNLFWRNVIGRWGESRVLRWTIITLGLYPFLAGILPSLTAILFAAGINGLMSPGVNLSHFNTLLGVIPDERRPEYTALYVSIVNIGAFISPLIGIALAGIFGFQPVLIGCGLLSILGSTSFWIWRVPQPGTIEIQPAA